MERPEIQIEDLLIRPWRAEDAEAVHRACQDPEIHRWTPIGPVYEMSDALKFVTELSTDSWANGTAANFGVFDLDSGELLASMGLVRIDQAAAMAELGYWTAPWARGRGVATRAGRAVTTWGFDALRTHRMIWRADVGNHASRLVALRIGFRMEGTQRAVFPAATPGGARRDGWIAAMCPGDVLATTPPSLAPGSPAARRAAAFGTGQPTLVLADGRGTLRLMTEADIDPVTAAVQDPETVRWTTVPPGYQRPDGEFFVRDATPKSWREGQAATFAIADPGDAYCGGIDLRIDPGDPAVAEIGFQVAPWARGNGYATAAMKTVANWGFDALGLTRIVWRAHLGNEASRRVAEKAGFTFEGVARAACAQRGERRDALVAAMLASDPRPEADR